MSTSIVIAEGQTVTRQAVRLLVERAGYRVLAEAADGMSAVQRMLQHRPDIVVIGLQMRRLSGLEAIRRIHRELPRTRIVVLSALDSAHSMSLCAQAGATAFVSKQGELSELISALDAVRRGRSWFPAMVEGSASSEAAQLDALSARERLVLSYLVKGERLRHIAAELALSESTVSTYKRRLLEKLNAASVVELAEIVRRSEADAPPAASPAPVRAVLDALPFHATIRDPAGRVLFLNRYGREALGERAQRLTNTDFVEHAALLGIPTDQASELEYVFADAVRSGKAYRREITLDGMNGIVAALHWGAPLNDGNRRDAMLCGSINVTDQEEAFVALREQLAQAELSARQKDGLIQHCLQTLAPEIGRLGALIAQAPSARAVAEAGAAVDALRASLNRLALLARVHDDTASSTLERCTPAALVRSAIDQAGLRHAQAKIALEIATPHSAARTAWLDRQAFDDLLGLLLDAALGNTRDMRAVRLELKTSARSRGLLDLQLVIDAVTSAAHRTTRRRKRDAWLMPACQKIAHRIGASLDHVDNGPRCRFTLKTQMQRTQDRLYKEPR
ncbi:response regulator transcription factor [Burkholderia sp. Ax-1719]|uniref:response regulator transcription factor n=1 Tax=Burkholderia sp. Ax-1719 TaxID=2608334 RepID=UPI00142364AD|nr:response regulator transcription factor [Burkholderia sp. Ax-1719]NIE62268.1 response regulator transcription factor [Burkholderia sp. Ax-1719]